MISPFFFHALPKIEGRAAAVMAAVNTAPQIHPQNALENIMKKTLINLAISTSLLAVVASAQAESDKPPAGETGDRTSQYVGLGVGAATGAIVAGPVGLVIGGIVGSIAGWNNEQESETEAATTAFTAPDDSAMETAAAVNPPDTVANETAGDALLVASAAPVDSVVTGDAADHSAALRNILTTDLSLDVYFRSGSTSVEAFYAPRMQAIAALMREMPMLELHLDGYSDRRGSSDDNLALSNQRLDAVRVELLQAGIDDSRIRSTAHGEQRFVSSPGDLEAYTFDRRVVIHFEQTVPATKTPVASIADLPRM
jgi:sortase system peptidoglycan-associated protein